ncbi:hypothetical protein TIN4_53 [Tsukamurella phage TIN4]|uniref:Uncharacterized protein n=2 Tax=Tinduovirus TIN3 TaxID=1982571 RepID=A0A0K0N619_9CAUD|nr:hypothetical protein AVT54_gp072 [Tsukamurella phage TIN3]YP_009604183.1 hypothetical protein FDH87_gp072 [Tsukamurella phage TIN4]AKJ71850.1 hypothetical protein TIN3_53 [Tsukamurella phage TIN3]AKJ71959.1 hypothetical protein TIN4_53 [Tsukamurella phage TIN4]
MKRFVANKDPNTRYDAFVYREPDVRELHRCSVPNTAQEAVDYIDWVERTFKSRVDYLEGRVHGTRDEYETINWEELDERTGHRSAHVPVLLRP